MAATSHGEPLSIHGHRLSKSHSYSPGLIYDYTLPWDEMLPTIACWLCDAALTAAKSGPLEVARTTVHPQLRSIRADVTFGCTGFGTLWMAGHSASSLEALRPFWQTWLDLRSGTRADECPPWRLYPNGEGAIGTVGQGAASRYWLLYWMRSNFAAYRVEAYCTRTHGAALMFGSGMSDPAATDESAAAALVLQAMSQLPDIVVFPT